MARARNIKPGFFKDAKVVACSFEARLLFQGLWCMADYMGRLKYVPLEIKMELFPADQVDVESCIDELSNNGLIEIYRDNSGTALVQVTNFTKHQNPHVNEKQDRNKKPLPCLPGPNDIKKEVQGETEEKPPLEQRVKDALVVLREYSESDPADSLNLIPDSPFIKKPSSGSSEPNPKKQKKYSDADLECAQWMLNKIVEVIPDFKKPKNLDGWANDIRLAREQDNRTHDQLKTVWAWCRADSFENANVQSPGKLRARFDGLKAKALAPSGQPVSRITSLENRQPSTRDSSLVDDLTDRSWAT